MIEDNLLSLSYGRIIRKDIDTNEGLLPASFEGYQIVEEGDTVLRLTDLQNDQRSLRAGFVNERGIITCAYSAVRPTLILARWLFNALRAADLLKVFYSMGGGVRQSLDFESIKRIEMPIPPREEQIAIDAYLIAEEARIKSAISSQARMIELLKERRSVIITQAVTRGLDPQAKMKDSGVPWLGHVPAHWEVKGLKFLLSANQGGAWGDEPTGLGDTVVLRSTEQTQTGEWRIEDPEVRSLSETERKKTLLKKGDILVTKASGSEAHIGKASLVDDAVASLNAGYSNFMQRLRARPGIEPRLILFMLNSKAVRDQFVYLSNSTSGLGNISASILNNVLVAEPPESEQFGIVEHIAKECRGIDLAINKEERMIELLKERRTALITQAVTGQIDVR
jgi:type I restriction enzyme S subunit